MSNKAAHQYLQRYAEVETALLEHWPAECSYHHVLLIPAYKEATTFLHNTLNARWFNKGVLLVLIVNQPDSEHNATPQQTLHADACQHSATLWQAGNLRLLAPHNVENTQERGHLLVVDRFHHPLPEKQGVGLARKIGADLALALIQRGLVKSEWIGSTDADASLPDDYFSVLTKAPNTTVAACYDFTHVANAANHMTKKNETTTPEITDATLTYERAMRYYVAGLRYARSSYAHFTIGSIIAFKANAYAQVRGFPKRAAGEDFYLLNKLVKLGTVARLKATIQLQARLSDRVPFGTGVSTAHIMQLQREGKPFCYYHPQIFEGLRDVLEYFDRRWEWRGIATDQWRQELPTTSTQALLTLGLGNTVEKLQQQCRSKQQFDRQFTGWFDGLKTLQFIHLLRDTAHPNLPLEHAIKQAIFMP